MRINEEKGMLEETRMKVVKKKGTKEGGVAKGTSPTGRVEGVKVEVKQEVGEGVTVSGTGCVSHWMSPVKEEEGRV